VQCVSGSRKQPKERTCHDQLKSEEVPCFVSRAGFGNGRLVEDRPKRSESGRKKMRGEWGKWMSAHSKIIISTDAGGKTKRVTSSGIADTKNDIILYSIVEAESHEAAAKLFENHPHLQIPQSTIEVMEIKPMGGM
jgi:hypothetical protein